MQSRVMTGSERAVQDTGSERTVCERIALKRRLGASCCRAQLRLRESCLRASRAEWQARSELLASKSLKTTGGREYWRTNRVF